MKIRKIVFCDNEKIVRPVPFICNHIPESTKTNQDQNKSYQKDTRLTQKQSTNKIDQRAKKVADKAAVNF